MIDEETQKAEGWLEFERFVSLLQSSVRTADLILEKEAVGDIHFAITELTVSAPVELGVGERTERPLVRLPSFDEVVKTDGNIARITFSLRPVPVEGGERSTAAATPVGTALTPKLSRLLSALEDQDYRDRLRAVAELAAMGPAAAAAREALQRLAKEDRSSKVRRAATAALARVQG